jgi:hypothetical protein
MKDNFDDIECLNCMDGKYDSWQCPSCGRTIDENPISSHAVFGDGWRDAMKETPQTRGYYLCYTEKQYNRYVIALWNDFMWSGVCYEVKAWMALPDPPAFA